MPCRTIVNNAGDEGSVVVGKLLEGDGSLGYDASTGQYVDLIKAGIIDPVKVRKPPDRPPARRRRVRSTSTSSADSRTSREFGKSEMARLGAREVSPARER